MRWIEIGIVLVCCTGLAGCSQDADDGSGNGAGNAAAAVPSGQYFSDITKAVGIEFKHEWGAGGRKFMPETVGSGSAIADFNGDGRMDLYLVNQAAMPGTKIDPPPTNHMFFQNADGTFEDVTQESGTGDGTCGMGCAVADYDGDGDKDLFLANLGRNILYRNRGDGTFEDVTETANLHIGPLWSMSAIFCDYDGDNDIDLFVVNYVDWTVKGNQDCKIGGLLAYCTPAAYRGNSNQLFRNDGDGTYTDVTKESGIYTLEGKGLGVAVHDYDADGHLDIYIANDGVRNFLFHNLGGGKFEEVAIESGTAYNESGNAEAGMGVDMADMNGDGMPDIFVTNLDNELNNAFINVGDGLFDELARPTGLGMVSNPYVGFGTRIFDYENDGDGDVYVTNGHITDNIEQINPAITYAQDDLLFLNDGKGRFAEVLRASKDVPKRVGRGLAVGDIDNDGDLDLLVTNNNQMPILLRNDQKSGNGWIGFRLSGDAPNRDALGAIITMKIGAKTLSYRHRQRGSFVSAHDDRIVIGIGSEKVVRDVTVKWPGGLEEKLGELQSGHYYEVAKGKEPVRIP